MTADLTPQDLLTDLRSLIEGARQRVATAVNQELTMLYWQVGHRIHTELLGEERGAYGKEIVATVSGQLEPAYGRGFSKRNLHRMVRLATAFPDEGIVTTLSAQLGWSHFCELLLAKAPLGLILYASERLMPPQITLQIGRLLTRRGGR